MVSRVPRVVLRYSGWLLGYCYAVARVPGVVARVPGVVARVLWVIARVLLCGC